jgi:hypothetical protein
MFIGVSTHLPMDSLMYSLMSMLCTQSTSFLIHSFKKTATEKRQHVTPPELTDSNNFFSLETNKFSFWEVEAKYLNNSRNSTVKSSHAVSTLEILPRDILLLEQYFKRHPTTRSLFLYYFDVKKINIVYVSKEKIPAITHNW